MFYRRLAGAVLALAIAGLGSALLASPARADENTVSVEDAGPVGLSGTADPAKPNAGEHVTLGSLDLGPGEWTISASVRLFVGDPDPAANDGRGLWKNSQGCGIYVGGERAAGAGGSSSLWTPTGGGKEVLFDATAFLLPPDWLAVPLVLQVDNAALVELVCFVDQSHSGATFEQRGSFAATDIALTAVRPAVCEVAGLEALLADAEECQPPASPDPTPTVTPSPGVEETPAAVQVGGGNDELPVTGSSVLPLAGVGGAAVVVGVALTFALRRKRAPTFTA